MIGLHSVMLQFLLLARVVLPHHTVMGVVLVASKHWWQHGQPICISCAQFMLLVSLEGCDWFAEFESLAECTIPHHPV